MIEASDLPPNGPAGALVPPPNPRATAQEVPTFGTAGEYEVGRPGATDAGFWDVAGAAWSAETIRTDAWGYMARKRKALSSQMYDLLSSDAKGRIAARQWDYENNWIPFEQLVLDEAAKERADDPTRWAGLPASKEEFDTRLQAERAAEFEEAQSVLDQPGGGLAEFLGSSARAMTDEINVLLAPLGLEGSALRVIGSQAALGALGEAAILPRESQVAAEMGLPSPDAWTRIGMGAVLGGGLTAGLVGAGRAFRWYRDRRLTARALAPTERGGLEAEIAVDAAEADLRGNQTVQEKVAPDPKPVTAATPAGPVEFDYRPQGNASPRTNRVGYVYGKLIELGYEPHIAAGLAGNFMQESGPSLNTRIVGDGGASVGIAQWNSGRRRNLERFAAKRGTSPDDLDTQIAFVDWELKNTETAAWAEISRTTNARDAALAVSQHYERPGRPHNDRRVAFAEAIHGQWQKGEVPKWDGATVLPEGGEAYRPYSGTSRGYTGEGQIAVGDEFRIDVEYQVVDLGSLIRASGDLQPRDRTRVASDAWIADTAARLDPAQLMPMPTADRGAPVVGPDNIIESGNGRVGAIERAYDLHPDRAQAYRAQIEAAGFSVPDGVERPVLIARRKTDLTPEQRRRAVVAAQDSGVAAMTPTETAAASARALSADALSRLDPAQPVTAEANGAFVRTVLEGLPRSMRNAMFDEAGRLNSGGLRQLKEAIFARAWPDPDILSRFAEGDAGELKGLLEALDRAAPGWAALKAEIEAGLVRPEMDISPFVMDAMRLVMAARDLSKRQNMPVAKALAELLDEVDLIQGPWSPLTGALVKKLWRDGRAVPADQVAEFLARYAAEARIAGREGGMFGGPGPRDVLVALDRETFGSLPEDLGQARGYARPAPRPVEDTAAAGFDDGAASPEAEAADAEIAADLLAPPPPSAPPDRPNMVSRLARDVTTAATALVDPDAAARRALADMQREFGDMELALPDGTRATVREVLDDLNDDAGFDAFIQACAIIPGGTE